MEERSVVREEFVSSYMGRGKEGDACRRGVDGDAEHKFAFLGSWEDAFKQALADILGDHTSSDLSEASKEVWDARCVRRYGISATR